MSSLKNKEIINSETEVFIIKANGESVPFSGDKLLKSLLKSGAGIEEANDILNNICKKIYPGISTKNIYRLAFKLLKKSSRSHAARYNLKNAIMQLGPSGFAFEKYIGEIFKHLGYDVKVGVILPGRCVNHEIDVLAKKSDHYAVIECKYHNLGGTVCNVKIPLYIHSRYKDIVEEWEQHPEKQGRSHEGWVVTNTRFTDDAIKYGNCIGLKLLGWNYPLKKSLKDLVDEFKLYPLTCLTTLTTHEKNLLLNEKIVLCQELMENNNYLSAFGIKPPRIEAIQNEISLLNNEWLDL